MYSRTWAGRLRVPILAVLIGGGALGCTNAKYIATSTGGPTDIKFLYVDQYGEQGVIKCARNDDGELSNCRRMRVVLKD